MGSDREKKLWWLSLVSVPILLAIAVTINAWRNIGDYRASIETDIVQGAPMLDYAGATWTLQQARLLGDGGDSQLRLPGAMRLIIVRLAATATGEIGQGWAQCMVSVGDGSGRRWLPLDVTLSNDISRDLDPDTEPLDGCGIASLAPPAKGAAAVIEEKFVVPADAVPALTVRLSVGALRPAAIAFPLGLN